MQVRRVVAGINANGKADILADASATRNPSFNTVPGFEASLIWSTTSFNAAGNCIDYDLVLDGEFCLELDAWRN